MVTAFTTTPVKGLRLNEPRELTLTATGALDNRVFFLVDERLRLVNGKRQGILSTVGAHYDRAAERLTLSVPGIGDVSADVAEGPSVLARFFSSPHAGQLVGAELAAALSEFTGQPLRLVRADPTLSAIDRGPRGGISLISDGSVHHLSEVADAQVDPRRFRMLIEVAGLEPHAEDAFVGTTARIGGAVVRFHGHVGRCLVTTQNPNTGKADLPTLQLLAYRKQLDTTEPLAFGVYGEVLEPGSVKLGDEVRAEP